MLESIISFVDLAVEPSERKGIKHPFLIDMEKQLSEDDYVEFLEACLDFEAYKNADEDIQNLVDAWFKLKE